MKKPFIERIKIKNIFSFDSKGVDIELKPLNVLIGPNGAGKSNFINVLDLIFALPSGFYEKCKYFGGLNEMIWKGDDSGDAVLELVINILGRSLRHILGFKDWSNLDIEIIKPFLTQKYPIYIFPKKDNEEDQNGEKEAFYFKYENGIAQITAKKGKYRPEIVELKKEDYNHRESILLQRQDPITYPELTWLRDKYHEFMNHSVFRNPDPNDLKKPSNPQDENKKLWWDYKNLAIVVNKMKSDSTLDSFILQKLRALYCIEDIQTPIVDGKVSLKILEKYVKKPIPLQRLSDGTLRFLRLLVILLNPDAPEVICIEEPEVGLHPEVIPTLAETLMEASENKQVIVTTHSPELIDALTSQPEAVIVCEREDAGTQMKRLDRKDLEHWLKRYRLGELWGKGVIGGTRY